MIVISTTAHVLLGDIVDRVTPFIGLLEKRCVTRYWENVTVTPIAVCSNTFRCLFAGLLFYDVFYEVS